MRTLATSFGLLGVVLTAGWMPGTSLHVIVLSEAQIRGIVVEDLRVHAEIRAGRLPEGISVAELHVSRGVTSRSIVLPASLGY